MEVSQLILFGLGIFVIALIRGIKVHPREFTINKKKAIKIIEAAIIAVVFIYTIYPVIKEPILQWMGLGTEGVLKVAMSGAIAYYIATIIDVDTEVL